MKRVIYADNAATTKLDETAFDAMKPFLLEEYGNPSQPYSLSRAPKQAIRDARETIAACIGAKPEEIYFTSGGTESNNWAIKGSAFSDADKRAMITSAFEHHAVLHACTAIERLSYPVTYLWPDQNGIITPDNLSSVITNDTRLVSIMYANNEIGSIQPIKELAQIAHKNGACFHTDAVQAVGHVPIDVEMLGIDMLSASAHKFNGPKGIGFLYIRKGTALTPLLDGGAQESNLRAGTENVASVVGMAAALKQNYDHLSRHYQDIKDLESKLLAEMKASGIHFQRNGDEKTLPGLLSLSFEGKDGEAILHRMDLMGICISTGSACDSKNTEVSHVLKAIKLDETLAKGTIRISLGKDNTDSDVEMITKSLVKILR